MSQTVSFNKDTGNHPLRKALRSKIVSNSHPKRFYDSQPTTKPPIDKPASITAVAGSQIRKPTISSSLTSSRRYGGSWK